MDRGPRSSKKWQDSAGRNQEQTSHSSYLDDIVGTFDVDSSILICVESIECVLCEHYFLESKILGHIIIGIEVVFYTFMVGAFLHPNLNSN